MVVSIFDPSASVVFVNSAGSSAENTVKVSVLVPVLEEMKLKNVSRGSDVSEGDESYVLINVEIEDPAYTGGAAPVYSENAHILCHTDFEVPNLTKDDYEADYAGVQIDVYAVSEDGTASAKAKSRKLTIDKSVDIG